MLSADGENRGNEFDQFYPALRRIARQHLPPHEVEDAVQETLKRFLEKAGKDETINNPAKFVQGIIYNVIHEFHRKRKEPLRDPDIDIPAPDPEDEVDPEIIRKSLATLEPFCQKLICAHVVEEKTFAELEALLGEPHSTLHRKFRKCMQKFARELERNGIKK